MHAEALSFGIPADTVLKFYEYMGFNMNVWVDDIHFIVHGWDAEMTDEERKFVLVEEEDS